MWPPIILGFAWSAVAAALPAGMAALRYNASGLPWSQRDRAGRMTGAWRTCGVEEWDTTVVPALRRLPEGSLDWVEGGAKLRWRLQDLGFLSGQEFARWCSSQGR